MKHPGNTSPVPPAWLRWFVNDASKGILDYGSTAPIGCHFHFDESSDTWEVSLFVAQTEVIGGPMDGDLIPSGLRVEINRVKAAFDREPQIYWQSEKVADDDQLANHLSYEGLACGNKVWLRILHVAPQWAGPGRLFYPGEGLVENLW